MRRLGMLAAHIVFGAAWDGSPLAGAGDGPRSRRCPPGNQSHASGQREAFFMRRRTWRRFWSVLQSRGVSQPNKKPRPPCFLSFEEVVANAMSGEESGCEVVPSRPITSEAGGDRRLEGRIPGRSCRESVPFGLCCLTCLTWAIPHPTSRLWLISHRLTLRFPDGEPQGVAGHA